VRCLVSQQPRPISSHILTICQRATRTPLWIRRNIAIAPFPCSKIGPHHRGASTIQMSGRSPLRATHRSPRHLRDIGTVLYIKCFKQFPRAQKGNNNFIILDGEERRGGSVCLSGCLSNQSIHMSSQARIDLALSRKRSHWTPEASFSLLSRGPRRVRDIAHRDLL
jgi:hypothetical protein